MSTLAEQLWSARDEAISGLGRIGIALRAERIGRSLTFTQITELIGVDRATLSHIEHGRLLPSEPVMHKIVEFIVGPTSNSEEQPS